MVAKKQRGSIETSSALELKLETATSTVEGILMQSEKALKVRARESKKYMRQGQKLRLRRSRLLKKKINAQVNVNKFSNAKTEAVLKLAISDLAAVDKEISETRALRADVLNELNHLRLLQKQAKGYVKAIKSVNRSLQI